MTADRLVSVVGLGFGDCGKGLCVDHLVRRLGARTVVRFNGGAQAGHNVVLPDGRHHTFSQFGAGTLSAGVQTVLAHPVVVHPTALAEEASALARIGVSDAFARLLIDPRCRVTTPFHQAVGRLREWSRGAGAHGSCGAGFGETVDHALRHPDEALRWADLARPARAAAKLDAIRTRLRLVAEPWRDRRDGLGAEEAAFEWQLLDEDSVAGRWLARAVDTWARAPTAAGQVQQRLGEPGTLLFEGAQGALLDERHGFAPHTTWSATGTSAAEAVASESGLPARIEHIGVLRTYLTRHGAGPLPTEDAALDVLAEPHNDSGGHQGRFRRGHGDEVLLRYAIATVGRLHGLAITHADALAGATRIRWCTSYRVPPALVDASVCDLDPADAGHVVGLRRSDHVDAPGTAPLTRLLRSATPVYDPHPPGSIAELSARVASVAGCPVVMMAAGPTHADVVGSMA